MRRHNTSKRPPRDRGWATKHDTKWGRSKTLSQLADEYRRIGPKAMSPVQARCVERRFPGISKEA